MCWLCWLVVSLFCVFVCLGRLVVWLFVYVVDLLDSWLDVLVECSVGWPVDCLILLYVHRFFWLVG